MDGARKRSASLKPAGEEGAAGAATVGEATPAAASSDSTDLLTKLAAVDENAYNTAAREAA